MMEKGIFSRARSIKSDFGGEFRLASGDFEEVVKFYKSIRLDKMSKCRYSRQGLPEFHRVSVFIHISRGVQNHFKHLIQIFSSYAKESSEDIIQQELPSNYTASPDTS